MGLAAQDAPVDLSDPTAVWGLLQDSLGELAAGFIKNLPLYLIGLIVFLIGMIAVRVLLRGFDRGLDRARLDHSLASLASKLVRAVAIGVVLLVALSVAGVEVGAALATLGIAGLALAFALQNILENFVAGILILIRKPFRVGDQIITDGFEGTVEDIDLRVTKLRDYDGEAILIPNSDVFTNAVTNLTDRPSRRTVIAVGVDYRDDHDRAREVIQAAVVAVEGVLSEPTPLVQCTELGESSVDFAIRYWTSPQNAEVQRVKDLVLRRVKSAIEAEGMTIPWPIRTLSFDDRLRVERAGED